MIRKIYRKIYKEIFSKISPIKYARKIGVNFLGDEHYVYGQVNWGTEPWIITIGNNVHITDGVRFITHDGGTLLYRKYVPDLEITKPISIGNNVYIGNCAMLLPGVKVGNNVIIGAGAIVTKNIPDNSVVAGVPARILKTADDYYKKIQIESLHLGNLKGKEKDLALKRYYKYQGKSKGIYF